MSAVGCEQVLDVSAVGCERVLDASVAGLLAGKHDGVVDRCGNNGGRWLLVDCGVQNNER